MLSFIILNCRPPTILRKINNPPNLRVYQTRHAELTVLGVAYRSTQGMLDLPPYQLESPMVELIFYSCTGMA